MFTTTTLTLLLATSANAFPIWSRFYTRDASSPAQLAQGSNFFFDSLHIEDQCTPGQIACISSNLAKCAPEGNWEITPCSGNNTCLAVPSSDNGVLVQCMLFTDAQAAIGEDSVSVDQGITEAPMNTATAVATPTATESASSTDAPTDSAPTDAPTDATPTDTNTDPSSTCTEEPEATETETITVILVPNPTESGAFVTSTLEPSVTEPVEEPSVTGTDAVVAPTDEPTSTDGASEPTCTETPEEPTETETDGSEEPTESTEEPAPTDTEGAEPTDSTDAPEEPTEDAPSDAPTDASEAPAPTDEITTESASATDGVTLTIAPGSPAPSPTASVPEVIVGGTHFIPSPSPSAPAKMRRVRRST